MSFANRPIDHRKVRITGEETDFFDEFGNINSRILFYRTFGSIAFVHHSYSKADAHEQIEERLKNSEYSDQLELLFRMTSSRNPVNIHHDPLEEPRLGQERIYRVGEGIMIHLLDNSYALLHTSDANEEKINSLVALIEGNTEERERKKLHKFSMITHQFGFDLEYFDIKAYDIDIHKQYNDDFIKADTRIRTFLDEPKTSGIILLHGLYGSGKTTYIRHLINNTEKNFIYVPINMVGSLNEPEFLPFITQYRDSVLIIEDCEHLIQSRKNGTPSNALVNLLNMGDGLLGDALQLKIICTFNAELSDIDEALLRKGRLVVRYYFDKLSPEKSVRLQKDIKRNNIVNEALTLAEIFNPEENDLAGEAGRKSIGFKR